MQYKFLIPGDPISWQRAGVSSGRFYDKQKHDKLAYGFSIANQFNRSELLSSPLALYVNFYFKPSKLRSKKLLTPEWCVHIQDPDIDNCIKFLMDSCVGVCIVDDNIICRLVSNKRWSDVPRTEFVLRELRINK